MTSALAACTGKRPYRSPSAADRARRTLRAWCGAWHLGRGGRGRG